MQAASARTHQDIYLPLSGKVMRSFSPPVSDFAAWVTLSARRGAQRHPAAVVDVVVVVTAVIVDVVGVVIVVGRAQPPPGSRP